VRRSSGDERKVGDALGELKQQVEIPAAGAVVEPRAEHP
jgi:hypothetical protein